MLGPELAECWLKLSRAEEHFNAFKSEVCAWNETHPYAVRNECRLGGRRPNVIVDIKNPAPLDRWSLIAGDCVGNLRSTLDYVVYAIAVNRSGKNPPPNARKLQFPICDTEILFEAEERRGRLNGLSAKAKAVIERAQPYNRPHSQVPSVLGVLRDFSDLDKHRLLNIALAHVTDGKINFIPPRKAAVDIHWLKNPIKSGDVIAFFEIDPPEPKVRYECEVTFGITIPHTPGPQGRHVSPLSAVLGTLIKEVKWVLNSMAGV